MKELGDCTWNQSKGYWLLASNVYARAMVDAKSPRIDVVINKNQTSFFETVLYKAGPFALPFLLNFIFGIIERI